MDTTEQVLPLPPHSEVLPFLPRVSPARRVRTCMRPGHASTHGPWSHRVNVSPSSFSTPFWGVGGNKIQPFNLSSLLWLKSWPPFFFHCLFFFFPLILSILFLYLSHLSSFSVLKYDQKCGKLEGDAVLCPSQGDRGREMSDFCQAWGRRVLRVARPSQLPRARWARPVGFMQWDSKTPSFSEKKTFLPVTTE